MQFSKITFVAIMVAAVSGAAVVQKRDTHAEVFCVDIDKAVGFSEGDVHTENNDATQDACYAYRARVATTSNFWDSCPDCNTYFSGDVNVCRSPARHIGGNEFSAYCKSAGADGSHAAD